MVLVYRALRAEYLEKDLLATFERFGNSKLRDPFSESVFARPALVIGNRFQSVLATSAVRGIDLEPVIIRSRV